ncbi:hypothetical protein ACFYZU_33785 [Streptomyces sp. NPDC001651]|uniref:hypothetical protein n=1 Tax=Streptomyces sp. NPDC001651 TaxID=3364596 RepID=UPI00367ACAB1
MVTTNLVIDAQEKLARRQRLDRIGRAGWAVSWLSLLTAVIGTGITWLATGTLARFVLGDLIFGSLLLMSLLALVGVRFAGRDLPTLQRIEAQLASAQESLWAQKENNTDVGDRRKLYREEVTTAIEQDQADSRKYRRIHNSLQTLTMIGSPSTTTIAAPDTGKDLTWQPYGAMTRTSRRLPSGILITLLSMAWSMTSRRLVVSLASRGLEMLVSAVVRSYSRRPGRALVSSQRTGLLIVSYPGSVWSSGEISFPL